MRATAGDQRLANRLLVLQHHRLEPELSARQLGRKLNIHEATVHSILDRFGNADIYLGAPPAAKGAGRPREVSQRWLRCVLCTFVALNSSFACQPLEAASKEEPSLNQDTLAALWLLKPRDFR